MNHYLILFIFSLRWISCILYIRRNAQERSSIRTVSWMRLWIFILFEHLLRKIKISLPRMIPCSRVEQRIILEEIPDSIWICLNLWQNCWIIRILYYSIITFTSIKDKGVLVRGSHPNTPLSFLLFIIFLLKMPDILLQLTLNLHSMLIFEPSHMASLLHTLFLLPKLLLLQQIHRF